MKDINLESIEYNFFHIAFILSLRDKALEEEFLIKNRPIIEIIANTIMFPVYLEYEVEARYLLVYMDKINIEKYKEVLNENISDIQKFENYKINIVKKSFFDLKQTK